MTKCLLFLLFPMLTVAQERVDEKSPDVKVIATLNSLVGWTKNDLGKWLSFPNALPAYEHENAQFSLGMDLLLKIGLAEIKIKNMNYLCMASFGKHSFIKNGIKYTEYPVESWLFDPSHADTLVGNDLTLIYLRYTTKCASFLSGFALSSWNKIAEVIYVRLDDETSTDDQLCIQLRRNK